MHLPASVPNLDELASTLVRLHAACSASELHGVLTGLLAGGARFNRHTLQKVLETHAEANRPIDDAIMAQLWQLQLKTLADLGDSELVFTPLLPDDDEDLTLRVGALSDWCQGFLVGFGTAVRPNDTRVHNESVHELLQDIVQVSHVDPDANAQSTDESNEAAYVELYEFIRMATIQLFEEMAPSKEHHHEPDDTSVTLH
jgi:yecA family protein